ncbi:MAG: MFS transporter [Microcoleaceae cyanobacterium]
MTLKKNKKALDFWQIWNMSVGFFGIQFGWALQMANTSAIYEYLGANVEQIPILWLAAPISGLIAQPIVGYFSDRTWTRLGRRRPYFLVGAILSSIALILMPNSSTLWMAAGLLWILDTSINISMEPFRAFVADILPANQQTKGFAMQSFFIGLGAVAASVAPWCFSHWLGIQPPNPELGMIPFAVKLSFYIGAALFLFTVIWTVVTTPEYPPQHPTVEKQSPKVPQSISVIAQQILSQILNMPRVMRQLAVVQFFTWMGMFCVFLYFPPAVAHGIFGAIEQNTQLYTDGIEWAGICIAVYNLTCFLFAWILPRLVNATSPQLTHSFCLFCGGCGLASLAWIRDPYLIFIPMICLGIAWASILSMPYAMLSSSIPNNNMGFYMGIFNAFIVIPQIIVALGLGWVMTHFFHGDHLLAIVLGGCCLLIASLFVHGVDDIVETDLSASALTSGMNTERN